ncbi:two-component regulator propeller domain-containing protein [Massilia sp. W12]|uniref:sensor histidine kinase n=1 Tax=Massilia sp. W12 TaxID=3126507 RepID=UPI0030CE48CA
MTGQHLTMRYIRRLHLIASIMLLALCLHTRADVIRTLRFELLQIDAALATETVTAITQDRYGFIWLGSENGLRRYDGFQIKHYKAQKNTPGHLQNHWINVLQVDHDGVLWVGTRGGLHRYNPNSDTFTLLQPPNPGLRSKGHLQINAILPEFGKGLWLGTGDGLQYLDILSGNFRSFAHQPGQLNGPSDNQIHALAYDREGGIWIGSNAGLDRYLPQINQFQHYSMLRNAQDDPKRNQVHALSLDQNNVLWIGAIGGLEAWQLRNGEPQRRRFGQAEGLPAGWITSLLQDAQGSMWIGSFEGLYLWDSKEKHFHPYRNLPDDPLSLPDNRIASLFQDRQGVLWVSPWFSGVARSDLASGGFTSHSKSAFLPQGLKDNNVTAITRDIAGGTWLGGGAGLHQINGSGIFRHLPLPAGNDEDAARKVNDIKCQPGPLCWIASGDGLLSFNPATMQFSKRMRPGANEEQNFIRKVLPQNDGQIWLGTRGGLLRYDPLKDKKELFTHHPGQAGSLSDNLVRDLLRDSQGRLWVGTFDGLNLFLPNENRFIHFKHEAADPFSLANNHITFLLEDKRGRIWVGNDAGVQRMEFSSSGKPLFRKLSLNMPRKAAYAMLEDKDGHFWISHEHGVARLNQVSDNYQNYTAADGLSRGSFSLGAALAGPDGVFYFGSESGGLTEFLPGMIRKNPHPPQVVITAVHVNQQLLQQGNEKAGLQLNEAPYQTRHLRLSSNHVQLALEFSALHFANPAANRYTYILQGYERDWRNTDAKNRRAEYANLPAGEYTFIVRAANKDGLWEDSGASMRITVRPPLWRSWWFLLSLGTLCILLALAIYRRRMNSFARQRRELEQQVEIRTAEVIQQKQLVERQKRETELKNDLLHQQKYELEREKENVELAHHNLSVLSEIGREITATLDRNAIMQSAYTHIQGLLDATAFAIYLLDQDKGRLVLHFQVAPPGLQLDEQIASDDLLSSAARALREQREITLDLQECEACGQMQSQMYAPLSTGKQHLGVMSILSRLPHAYNAREQLIFRTLCAYVAIALENAGAFEKLEDALQTLRTTQLQMVQQEKMASLGTLTAGVAHEINNPANFAHVGAQALALDLERFRHFLLELAGADAEQEVLQSLNQRIDQLSKQIGTIIEGTTRIKNLVLDLRTFSRLDQASKKSVAIGDSLLSTVNLVRTEYAQSTEIQCRLEANPVLECFPAELNQVFMNLIVNACQAIQAKQRRQPTPGRGHLRIASRIAGGWLEIDFEDDGEGIPPQVMAHIFEPFYTTKNVGEGTGLGLSISFGIIEKHQGNISVRSTPGSGSCFTLRLPLAGSESGAVTKG